MERILPQVLPWSLIVKYALQAHMMMTPILAHRASIVGRAISRQTLSIAMVPAPLVATRP
jgi:hypothetical protein